MGALTCGQDSGWKRSESRFGLLLKKLGSDEKQSRQVLAKSCPTLVLELPSSGSTSSLVNSSKVSLFPELPQNKFCQWVFWGEGRWVLQNSHYTPFSWLRVLSTIKCKWQPTPVALPEKSQAQRSLVGYSLEGSKEWDTTEHTCRGLTGIQQSSQPLKSVLFRKTPVWAERKPRFYQEPPSMPPQTTVCQTQVWGPLP